MAIDRLPWYLVVALIEKDLFWRRVPMNNAFIKDMIDAEKSFWYDHVRSGVPPLPTGSDIDAEYLLKLYPRGEGELYLPELGATCQEYKTLAEKIEDLERRRTEISNTFKARMGNAKLATCEGYKITWSRFKKSQFDRKGLEKALPDIATKYTREIDVDRLTVTELKKK
jgi:predicted phage-related endonuclease